MTPLRVLTRLLPFVLLACRPLAPPIPDNPMVLGWRLAPGMELTYKLDTRQVTGQDEVRRSETWRYLVRSIDDSGVYLLEGRLVDLDASISHAGKEVDRSQIQGAVRSESRRLGDQPVTLSLSMDGRIDGVRVESWADSMPHRLLAMKLPEDAVKIGDRWSDPAASRPMGEIIPATERVDFNGTEQLESVRWAQDSSGALGLQTPSAWLEASIQTSAVVIPKNSDIPSIDIEGSATWNLDRGLLMRRHIKVQERGGALTGQAGSFEMSLELVDRQNQAPAQE